MEKSDTDRHVSKELAVPAFTELAVLPITSTAGRRRAGVTRRLLCRAATTICAGSHVPSWIRMYLVGTLCQLTLPSTTTSSTWRAGC